MVFGYPWQDYLIAAPLALVYVLAANALMQTRFRRWFAVVWNPLADGIAWVWWYLQTPFRWLERKLSA